MSKLNTFKIVVIVTPSGVESVTVHSKEYSSRILAYTLCEKLEPKFQDINRAISEGQGVSNETPNP
jgi:hypothetical protein